MANIAFQPELRPAPSSVAGPLEYRMLKEQFENIDKILVESGIEFEFLERCLEQTAEDNRPRTEKALDFFITGRRVALRSVIARRLLGADYREFSIRLADSSLLQWFTLVGRVDRVKAFAKSSAWRHEQSVDEELLREINSLFLKLLGASSTSAHGMETASEKLGLERAVSFEQIWCDTTCLKAHIHFPVDWVLLRDAVRTLMKATVLIRKRGLKNRMPQEPMDFLSDVNTLCMEMSACNRKKGSKREQKFILRKMKKLSRKVAGHAEAHMKILDLRWQETDLSEAQAQRIKSRIESVLEQLPAAIKQAHERIIGGRQVASKDKILSLYDPDVEVIVRGKAAARSEFGNKLWFAENEDGLIVDYKLLQNQSADSTLVKPALERMAGAGIEPEALWGDRGFSSVANTELLERNGIRDGLCPRCPRELKERLEEDGFREGLKRRASTEARVAILGGVFLGTPLRAKGFVNRELAVGWAVLVHNLWVTARLIQSSEKARTQARAA